MKHFIRNLVLGISLSLVSITGAASAAMLLTDNNQLTGVEGLVVGQTTYDVSFVDGSCIAVFDGCDDYSDFFFTDDNVDAAIAAYEALEALVFQDTTLGAFDTIPELTLGCDSRFGLCGIRTPVSLGRTGAIFATDFIPVVGFNNDVDEVNDNVTSGTSPVTASSNELTYAVFTSVTPVPLPASGMMYLALAGVLAMLRRRSVI